MAKDALTEDMKAIILALLQREDVVGTLAVTTAMVRLYANQTEDERATGKTRHQNGRGFNGWDDERGSYMARYALGSTKPADPNADHLPIHKWDEEVAKLKNREATPIRLISGRFLEKARKMAIKYHAQLVAEALVRKACEAP